ncbi:alpha/beta hydrolase [Chitinophaga qingshengii]|uniref:Alpha/beta fold hydrolase n=1 Tax=Chitinophaga qingshengii TaxID=1569794 RepID=A0ABR7TVM1_9BACT|nr:alpha/beta fold hydrolase [Chitinophaga qingshengii]MBC9933643.1 alpha/beta fold hydrolase [Chitinophaga qingshengii]
MRRFFKKALYTLLFITLLFNCIAAFHAWKFTHFYENNRQRNKRPEEMNVGEKLKMIFFGVRLSKSITSTHPNITYDTVQLLTSNGLHLEGWWMPVPNAKGSVILFHGYGGNKGGPLPEAYWFRQLGYNTFLLDFRGHGNSDGSTCTIGYKEAEDVKLAWDYVQARSKQPITLWGVSMGAAAVLKAVPEYHLTPQKIILEAPFATLVDAVRSRMRAVHLPATPLSQMLTFWGGLELGFWGFGHNPQDYARQVKMPVLLFWGQRDPRVTNDETRRVFNQLASPQKQLYVFKDAAHQSFCMKDGPVWKQLVKDFMAK